jgi:hypothetical protein
MFTLTIHDRNGVELNIGDVVKISDGKEFQFFAEVKYLYDEQILTPFHTFSFHSFEKVDKVPDNAIKSTETRYNIWYLKNKEIDNDAEHAERYLLSWRECERQLEKKCFRVKLNTQQKLF